MLIKEIKQALIGKVLSHYDGWNGSSDYFKIGYTRGVAHVLVSIPKRAKALGSLFPKHTSPNS